jgi:hypothetical protein
MEKSPRITVQIPQKVDIPQKVVIMQGIVDNSGLGFYAKYGLHC